MSGDPSEVTIREAAAILGVHENTVRNWIDRGVLKAHRIGGASTFRRLWRSDVEALVQPQTPRPETCVPHRLQVKGDSVTAVRERVERVLGVTTTARPEGHVWGIYFDAPEDADVDFLRPDVLPPREAAHV